MTKKQQPPENYRDSAEGSVEHIPKAIHKTPLGRFKTLTRQLLGVTREQVQEEQERYDADKITRPRRAR
jgi:hypothetical protein